MSEFVADKKTRQLLRTIDLLYDAVSNRDRWPDFLEAVANLFDAQGAQIGHVDLINLSVSFDRLYGYEWSVDHYAKYKELMLDDPRLPHFSKNCCRAVHCRMGITDAELHQSRMYREVLSAANIEYTLGTNLVDADRSMTFFLLLRPPTQPQFDASDCALLEELIPHLSRVFKLHGNIGKMELDKSLAFDTLDAMAVGTIVVTQSAQIKYANATAREILNEEDGISDVDGNLTLTNGNSVRFETCAQNVFQNQAISGEVIEITRPSARDPYNIVISSFEGNQQQFCWQRDGEALALLVLRDPCHRQEMPPELLERLYGLTPSQARLVIMVSTGLSIRKAAQEANITEASARQYIKLAFQKMDVNRQSEMVRKILNIPHAMLRNT